MYGCMDMRIYKYMYIYIYSVNHGFHVSNGAHKDINGKVHIWIYDHVGI